MQLTYWYVLLILPFIFYLFFRKGKKSALKFSNVNLLKIKGRLKSIKYKIGRYLIMTAAILLVFALARPRIEKPMSPFMEKGIDIAMLLDVSGSMQSVDFTPNRLEAAKKTIDNFIINRHQDRAALIVFAGNAYTRVPLTLDHEMISKSIEQIDVFSVKEDGTAIGMAISVGMNRLKKSEAVSKVMILVTDGDNNAGSIDPITACRLAKDLGIKIYTIGVGTDETIRPYNFFGETRYEIVEGGINEELLKQIAAETGGEYYRAEDQENLSNIFNEINDLETTDFEQDKFKQYIELAYPIMKLALIILLIGLFLDKYYYIQIP